MAKDAEAKSKKENKRFFKDFKAELKKVIWPTPKQVVNNTIAVITIVLITAVIVFALDLIFKAINTYGIDSIRNLVKSESTAQDTTVENSNSEDETIYEVNDSDEEAAVNENSNQSLEPENSETDATAENVSNQAQENTAEDNNVQE